MLSGQASVSLPTIPPPRLAHTVLPATERLIPSVETRGDAPVATIQPNLITIRQRMGAFIMGTLITCFILFIIIFDIPYIADMIAYCIRRGT